MLNGRHGRSLEVEALKMVNFGSICCQVQTKMIQQFRRWLKNEDCRVIYPDVGAIDSRIVNGYYHGRLGPATDNAVP